MGIFDKDHWETTAGAFSSTIVGLFGKNKTQAPVYAPYQVSEPPAVEKKDNTMIFVAGGGILAVMMMFMFFKK